MGFHLGANFSLWDGIPAGFQSKDCPPLFGRPPCLTEWVHLIAVGLERLR